uniref:Uncharacterized protein n=1 Tax=Anguilla anguilla TaxID=7936 RepID=A0A0E9QP68_ANGAN
MSHMMTDWFIRLVQSVACVENRFNTEKNVPKVSVEKISPSALNSYIVNKILPAKHIGYSH